VIVRYVAHWARAGPLEPRTAETATAGPGPRRSRRRPAQFAGSAWPAAGEP